MNESKGALLIEVSFQLFGIGPETLEKISIVVSDDFFKAREAILVPHSQVSPILYQQVKTVELIQKSCVVGGCPPLVVLDIGDFLRALSRTQDVVKQFYIVV